MVGEDVGAGDRLAEVAGAEEGDVVLAGGAQDLADLGDQRVDVVADPALAELAEAGEVAADLGRVDVGVLGELLRGDRLPAHLARLGQHLQVAREARRDAEREALAVDRSGPRRASTSSITSTMPPQYRAWPAGRSASRTQLGDDLAVDLDHRDPLQMAPQQQLVALDVDLAQLEAVALGVQRDDRRDRLLAEVAARPRVDDDLGHADAPLAGGEGVVAEVVGVRDRRARSGRRSRSSPRCRCRARAAPASGATPCSLAERRHRLAQRRRWRRPRRRARPPPTRPASAPAPASRSAGRPRPPGSWRRGRRGAPRRPRSPRSRQR